MTSQPEEPEFYRFGLPLKEESLEEVPCEYHAPGTDPVKGGKHGTLFISVDHVCFGGKGIKDEELLVIPLSDATACVDRKAGFKHFFDVTYEEQVHVFGGVPKDVRESITEVLMHMYAAARDNSIALAYKANVAIVKRPPRNKGNQPGDPLIADLRDDPSTSDATTATYSPVQPSDRDSELARQKGITEVDSSASRRALLTAQETRDQGAATMVELDAQGQQIKRTQVEVEEINRELDASKRILRGVDSVGGALQNGLSRDNTVPRSKKTIDELATFEDMDLPIVRINDRDKYQPRIIRIARHNFSRVLMKGEAAKTRREWRYDDVTRIVVKAATQRMTIRFLKGSPSLEFISAYAFIIENELLRRASHQIEVEHEEPLFKRTLKASANPGAGSDDEEGSKTSSSKALQMGFTSRAERNRQANQERNQLLSGSPRSGSPAAGTPAERDTSGKAVIQRQIAKDDQNVEEISLVLDDLKGMAVAMGTTLDAQNADLETLDSEVDKANAKLAESNKKLIKLTN